MSRNKKSLSDYILLVAENAIDGVVRLEDFMAHPHYYGRGYGWDYPLKKSSLSKAIARLREKGLVDVGEEGLVLRLTEPGRDKALWVKMRQDEKEWDGRWRLVFWDIPEEKRAGRDLLRTKLKQLGFEKWQKSVWASKKNCTSVLRDYIRDLGIGDWVFVIESDNIGRDI